MSKEETDFVYFELIKIYSERTIDITGITTLTTKCMELVEKLKDKNGVEKKQAVLDILIRFIDQSGLVHPDNKDDLFYVVRRVTPGVIDSIITAHKNGFKFNKTRCCFWNSCRR